MTDEQIIALYWTRDEQAIAATDGAYGKLCRSVSYNIVNDWEDAEECTNDTWHRAWDTMPPQRPSSLRAYLCRIVRNLSIDRWRAKKSQKRGEGLDVLLEELEACLPGAPSAEEEVEGLLLKAVLEDWLDSLPRADRVLFLRRYWYGDRVDELARCRGTTPNQTSQRLLKLRRALKKKLEQEGVCL